MDENRPPEFATPLAAVREGGLPLNRDADWELRAAGDALAGLVLTPRGRREDVRLLEVEGSWRVRWGGAAWRFLAQDMATGEPAALFARGRLKPGGAFTLAGGERLMLRRPLGRATTWTLGERRLWRSSRADDPDRFGGVWGDGGGGGGDGGGGGGGGG